MVDKPKGAKKWNIQSISNSSGSNPLETTSLQGTSQKLIAGSVATA